MSWINAEKKKPELKLTVVVIAYNMQRELPRTLKSLSVSMQKDISVEDYEVLVVDNGSSEPINRQDCRKIISNIRFHTVSSPTSSPVPAINVGIKLAKGELIGVFIDGARLASPGLLSAAIKAANFSNDAVIGTLAFHLGSDVQMRSIKEGYNQVVEDSLLEDCKWEDDGYRLFSVSVFAGASGKGWFNMPNESNALFMHRNRWIQLHGYEAQFVSPGGGLSNHDMWLRACQSSPENVILLFGEGTFHQVHGGIATNAVISKKELFHEEYEAIRGKPYKKPEMSMNLYGTPGKTCFENLKHSTEKLQGKAA